MDKKKLMSLIGIIITSAIGTVISNMMMEQAVNEKVNEVINKEDVTLLFVTHSTAVAKSFCKRGIVMNKGKKQFDGDIDQAIKEYENILKK